MWRNDLRFLNDLESSLMLLDSSKDLAYDEYHEALELSKVSNEYTPAMGFVACSFGVDYMGMHYTMLGFMVGASTKLDLILYFDKNNCADEVIEENLESVAVHIPSLLKGLKGNEEAFKRIIEIQKGYGKKISKRGLREYLLKIISACRDMVSEGVYMLKLESKRFVNLTLRREKHMEQFADIHELLAKDIASVKSVKGLLNRPIIEYFVSVNGKTMPCLGVVPLFALEELFEKYLDLKESSDAQAEDLLNYCNTLLKPFYEEYYPNVASYIEEPLIGVMEIASMYLASDFRLYEILNEFLE